MAKTRIQKEAMLKELAAALQDKAMVFTNYSTLTVRDLDQLRNGLRAIGAKYSVVKNTLLRKALEDAGLDVPGEILNLPLGIATSAEDEVEPSKVVVEFAKTNAGMKIMGAIIDGKFVDEAGVRALAALPGRKVLYTQVVGSIAAPLAGLLNVLRGNLQGLINIFNQYKTQKS